MNGVELVDGSPEVGEDLRQFQVDVGSAETRMWSKRVPRRTGPRMQRYDETYTVNSVCAQHEVAEAETYFPIGQGWHTWTTAY